MLGSVQTVLLSMLCCARASVCDPMRLFGANLCDQYLSEVWVLAAGGEARIEQAADEQLMVRCGGAGKCCTFSSSNHYPGGIRSVQRGGSVTVFEGCSCTSKYASQKHIKNSHIFDEGI